MRPTFTNRHAMWHRLPNYPYATIGCRLNMGGERNARYFEGKEVDPPRISHLFLSLLVVWYKENHNTFIPIFWEFLAEMHCAM